jgi:hypothetical protein
MADVLVEDKNGFSVNRNMTDSRDSPIKSYTRLKGCL